MKKMIYLLLVSCISISSFHVYGQETPDDYAYGAPLQLENEHSQFSRVELNQAIYTQTKSLNLADIRVFNKNGQPVSFALIKPINREAQKDRTFEMDIYPLESAPNEQDNHHYQLSVNSNHVQIQVDKLDLQNSLYHKTYLLQVPDEAIKFKRIPIKQLKFLFDNLAGENWQATGKLFYSDNLQDWQKVEQNLSFMSLTNNENNKQLVVNQVDFSDSFSYRKAKNWLIVLESKQPIKNLKKVQLFFDNENPEILTVPIDFSLTQSDDATSTYTYSLPSEQKVNKIGIKLNHSSLFAVVSAHYKYSAYNDWKPLGEFIINQIDENAPETLIPLDEYSNRIKEIQLRVKSGSFDEIPTLTAYRDKVDLVFYSLNNAPFTLAWGSISAQPASLNQSFLLNHPLNSIPLAKIGKTVKLASDSILDRPIISRWVIWACLLFTAVFLLYLAFKLLKGIKKVEIE